MAKIGNKKPKTTDAKARWQTNVAFQNLYDKNQRLREEVARLKKLKHPAVTESNHWKKRALAAEREVERLMSVGVENSATPVQTSSNYAAATAAEIEKERKRAETAERKIESIKGENAELKKKVKALANVLGESTETDVLRENATGPGTNYVALREHIATLAEIGAYRYDIVTGEFVPIRYCDVDHLNALAERVRSGDIADVDALGQLDILTRHANSNVKRDIPLADWVLACEDFLQARRKAALRD